MGATISRLAGIGLLLLLSNSLAAAGAPDLRLVNAVAEENTQAVPSPARRGGRCQHARVGWGYGASLGGPLG